MQGTVRLEGRTDKGKVKTQELITVRRPVMAGTLAEIGLTLAEAKSRLSKLQARMLCDQVAEYAVRCRVCPDCEVLQPLKDRPTRRLQTLLRCSTFPAGRSSPGTLRSRSRPGLRAPPSDEAYRRVELLRISWTPPHWAASLGHDAAPSIRND